MLQYVATYLYTRRGNKEESIKNERNDEQKQKEKKQRKMNKRKKERQQNKNYLLKLWYTERIANI